MMLYSITLACRPYGTTGAFSDRIAVPVWAVDPKQGGRDAISAATTLGWEVQGVTAIDMVAPSRVAWLYGMAHKLGC